MQFERKLAAELLPGEIYFTEGELPWMSDRRAPDHTIFQVGPRHTLERSRAFVGADESVVVVTRHNAGLSTSVSIYRPDQEVTVVASPMPEAPLTRPQIMAWVFSRDLPLTADYAVKRCHVWKWLEEMNKTRVREAARGVKCA